MDRGFEFMIPKPPEVKKKEHLFRQNIQFSLFGRTFRLYFSVKPTPE